MNEPVSAGLIAGAIAVTAGGGVSIVAEGWPETALVALAVVSAFGLGSWVADRRVEALVAVVRSFCAEAAGRFFADLKAAGAELLGAGSCPAS